MSQGKQVAWRWAIVMIVVAVSGLALQSGLSVTASAPGELPSRSMVATGSSFVYRFDPVAQTFVTIPLPIGSIPMHGVVTGTAPTHMWLTEYGRNQIGHLVFTDTNSFAWTEYPVTSTNNSQPYRLAIAGNSVWFTERGANRIGRLNTATGQLDEFYGNGLSPDGNLADIKVAPDGRVWIAAPGSQRLAQLVVTSTQVYAFHEYTDTYRPDFPVTPQYLAVEGNDSIWMTMPGRATFQLARLRPSIEAFDYATASAAESTLQQIVITAGDVWIANSGNDSLDQAFIETLPYVIRRVSVASPIGLATSVEGTFWVAQHTTLAAISRVIYTNTNNTFELITYVMPGSNTALNSIAVASDGGVWVVAYDAYRKYLPLIANRY